MGKGGGGCRKTEGVLICMMIDDKVGRGKEEGGREDKSLQRDVSPCQEDIQNLF